MSKKTKRRKLKIKNLMAIFLILILLLGAGCFGYYNISLGPADKSAQDVEFTVEKGESIRSVLQRMQNEGLINDANMVLLYAKLNGLTDIKMGTYILNAQNDAKTILEIVNSSTAALSNGIRLTFVEGDWAKHIAQKIAEGTNVSEDEAALTLAKLELADQICAFSPPAVENRSWCELIFNESVQMPGEYRPLSYTNTQEYAYSIQTMN